MGRATAKLAAVVPPTGSDTGHALNEFRHVPQTPNTRVHREALNPSQPIHPLIDTSYHGHNENGHQETKETVCIPDVAVKRWRGYPTLGQSKLRRALARAICHAGVINPIVDAPALRGSPAPPYPRGAKYHAGLRSSASSSELSLMHDNTKQRLQAIRTRLRAEIITPTPVPSLKEDHQWNKLDETESRIRYLYLQLFCFMLWCDEVLLCGPKIVEHL
ncbi:unnamed protein product [Rhizoctonia solani]|uniref:Uncharacterized protein n=1 Tax=Rhizoctonia solani TaxID=456999 RepID=A0A8H3E3T1_9AGAM|nr:unnamed protein product [Rhizoctonia solani]